MTKTIGFIPCSTNLFTIHINLDKKGERARVHAFKIVEDEDYLDLEPLIVVEGYLSDCTGNHNYAGLIDDSWPKEDVDRLVEVKIKELETKKAKTQCPVKR